MTNSNSSKPTKDIDLIHDLNDHDYGIFGTHAHLPGNKYDHDHDENFDEGPLEDNPLWQQDNIFLSTVGVDIGSSSTQIVFSQVHLERQGEALSSRYVVVDRRLLYQSPIFFTPYIGETQIDSGALGSLIDKAYQEAEIRPHDVDIGVVLLTGEALRRENSEKIAHVIAHKGGEFLSASAGHHMESNLAAYGSGAVDLSGQKKSKVLNVDIGGGTTKLAIIDSGQLVGTGAFHVGGRLLVWDDSWRIVRLEPRAKTFCHELGIDLSVGDLFSQEQAEYVGSKLAEILIDVVNGIERDDALWLTDVPKFPKDLSNVVFSGGVSEYMAVPEQLGHNDLGLYVGRCLSKAQLDNQFIFEAVVAPGGIRATALGASEFNIQVSGNTGHISNPSILLPVKNLPVVKLLVDADHITQAGLAERLVQAEQSFDLADYKEFSLAFEWVGEFDYVLLKTLCDAVSSYVESQWHEDRALYLLFDRDLAQSVGRILTDEIGMQRPLLVLDGLRFKDFEFVDLGRVRLPSRTVPVTVKSLLFQNHGMSQQKGVED